MSLSASEAIQTVIPSYLYQQFADDQDLQAFVSVYNEMSQGYLDWFNSTPLGLYTSSNISGPLLDWTLQGIYGIYRPVITSGTSVTEGPVATYPIGERAVGTWYSATVTSLTANDDLYKRLATWILYQGDGVQMTVQWLKRRVNRFINGAFGADTSLDSLPSIGVSISGSSATITVPLSPVSNAFALLLANNFLPLPMQMTFSVIVGSTTPTSSTDILAQSMYPLFTESGTDITTG